MKIKIMTAEAVAYVKNNIDSLVSYYENKEDPTVWIKQKIGKDAFIEVPTLDFEECELLISADAPSANEGANVKLFYLNYMQLNDSFATDERLWAGLAHTVYYEYMLKRWPNSFDSKSIINHFFFAGTGGPRSYMMNTLSRLWWLGRKTYRAESGEPWKIFDYFIHDINGYSFTLFGSNWSNSSRSLDLFFKAIFEYTEEYGRKVDRALFNEAMQYTNCLCGIYVLDACDDAFVVEEIKNYLVQRYDEMIRELADNKLNNVRTTGIEKFDNLIKAINYIGGHGKKVDIFNAYEAVTQTRNSTAIRMYIENQLQANCPDVRKYSGKPIFYKVVIEGGAYWKLANDYLIKANVPVRRELMMNQIETLSDVEKWVFNFITAIRKDRFTLDDLLQFSGQFGSLHPEVEDSERVMKDALIKMREKGLIELQDNHMFKKAFNIKADN